MIELQEVKLVEKELLYNVFQKYKYEMTKYYEDEMDNKGNYFISILKTILLNQIVKLCS